MTHVGRSAYFRGRLLWKGSSSSALPGHPHGRAWGCVAVTPAMQAQAEPPGDSGGPGSAPFLPQTPEGAAAILHLSELRQSSHSLNLAPESSSNADAVP